MASRTLQWSEPCPVYFSDLRSPQPTHSPCASYTGFLLLLEGLSLFVLDAPFTWGSFSQFFSELFSSHLSALLHLLREASLDNPISSIFPPTTSHLLLFYYRFNFFIAFTTIWSCFVLFTCYYQSLLENWPTPWRQRLWLGQCYKPRKFIFEGMHDSLA